jgi:hypothetical protein
VLPASITAELGGAWTRLAARAVLADASASTAPARLPATPSHSPIFGGNFGGDH